MKNIISIFAVTACLFADTSCSHSSCYTVDEVYMKGDSLVTTRIFVEGIVERVCKHTGKRFKIADLNGLQEIKVLLSDDFPLVDNSLIGKKVTVSGVLIASIMDKSMVMQWEKSMKENHKGEEETDHYQEELSYIQNIYRQIENGKIQYYKIYSIKADSYKVDTLGTGN
jgi:hypothetical protein